MQFVIGCSPVIFALAASTIVKRAYWQEPLDIRHAVLDGKGHVQYVCAQSAPPASLLTVVRAVTSSLQEKLIEVGVPHPESCLYTLQVTARAKRRVPAK